MSFNPYRYVEFVEAVATLGFDHSDDPVICRDQLMILITEAKEIEADCAQGAFNDE